MDLDRKQVLGVLGVAGALLALLVLPLVVQRYTGFSAVLVAFPVIVGLAALNWYLKNR